MACAEVDDSEIVLLAAMVVTPDSAPLVNVAVPSVKVPAVTAPLAVSALTPVTAAPVNVTLSTTTVPDELDTVRLVDPECVIAAAFFDKVRSSVIAKVLTALTALPSKTTASITVSPFVLEIVKSVLALAPVCVMA